MRIAIVTGIYPPDVGGPAAYVPAVAAELVERGHRVEVITLADNPADNPGHPYPVKRIRRGAFLPARMALVFFAVWKAARRSDVVYLNGLFQEGQAAAWLAGVRTVHKIVGDYAWERARNRGLFKGTIEDYQAGASGFRLRLMNLIRNIPLRTAREVIVPSEYLGRIVAGWGVPSRKINVIYNAVRGEDKDHSLPLPPFEGRTLVTVCRLVPWKGVDGVIRSLRRLPGCRLVVIGDGPLRKELSALAESEGVAGRVIWMGDLPKNQVSGYMRQADVFVLNSSYEGLPHVVLEAMEAQVPVIATDVGGTGEVIQDGRSGLLIRPGNDKDLLAAMERILLDSAFGMALSAAATQRLRERFSFSRMVDGAESLLGSAAGIAGGSGPRKAQGGLGVVSIGYTRSLWEEAGSDDTKRRMMDYATRLDEYVVIVNSYKSHGLKELTLGDRLRAVPTDAHSPLDSFAKMLLLGYRAIRGGKSGAFLIQAQDPVFTGAAAVLLGGFFRVPVSVCVYGPNVFDPHWINCNWTHRFLAPLGRWVLRRAQAVQVDGGMTFRSLRNAMTDKPIHLKPMIPTNLDRFLSLPVARDPSDTVSLLFVGRLDRQKNLPMLARTYKTVAERCGEKGLKVVLDVVGMGREEASFRASLADLGSRGLVRWHGQVAHDKVADLFGAAGMLVLSSWYEGYPRVLMEAAASGLPIVTTAVSGSDEAVADGVSGFIVPVGDEVAFADRVLALIGDSALRGRMAAEARRHALAGLAAGGNLERQMEIWKSVRSHTPWTQGVGALGIA